MIIWIPREVVRGEGDSHSTRTTPAGRSLTPPGTLPPRLREVTRLRRPWRAGPDLSGHHADVRRHGVRAGRRPAGGTGAHPRRGPHVQTARTAHRGQPRHAGRIRPPQAPPPDA